MAYCHQSVVSYFNSTSNHNALVITQFLVEVVSYFNSTSNHNGSTVNAVSRKLFLISILHQTTTGNARVYGDAWLFLISILHQTTTGDVRVGSERALFLISILHQTTTITLAYRLSVGCFLFQFYIKPQRHIGVHAVSVVVSYFNSTSNHNPGVRHLSSGPVVSYFNSTSNHNKSSDARLQRVVVSYFNSTSNHNDKQMLKTAITVVSYFNSTSNHNCQKDRNFYKMLFLISILHQTTTASDVLPAQRGCFLFQFYIKPQPRICDLLIVIRLCGRMNGTNGA